MIQHGIIDNELRRPSKHLVLHVGMTALPASHTLKRLQRQGFKQLHLLLVEELSEKVNLMTAFRLLTNEATLRHLT